MPKHKSIKQRFPYALKLAFGPSGFGSPNDYEEIYKKLYVLDKCCFLKEYLGKLNEAKFRNYIESKKDKIQWCFGNFDCGTDSVFLFGNGSAKAFLALRLLALIMNKEKGKLSFGCILWCYFFL